MDRSPRYNQPEQLLPWIASTIKNIGHSALVYLRTSDPNLGEGKLRSSITPAEYMEIPDYPPVHDDTIS